MQARKNTKKTEQHEISPRELKALIVARYGFILGWIREKGFGRASAYRIIQGKHRFVYVNSESGAVVRALEKDFGVTPGQLGIQILEVER